MGVDYSVLYNFNILYLEDDEFLLKYTKDVLDDFFKEVYAVQTIAKAQNIIKNKKVDLIISDILLKNENGLDFIRELKQNNINLPIILTTAHSNTDYLLEAIKLKIDNYLIKPIEFNDLRQTLYDILLPRIQNKENIQNNNIIKIVSIITDNKQIEVIKYLMNKIDDNCTIVVTYSSIMSKINISKPTLIKLFKLILEKSILVKVSSKTYRFNQDKLDKLI
jgi:DNA-binding NtrC family response regulator